MAGRKLGCRQGSQYMMQEQAQREAERSSVEARRGMASFSRDRRT